MNLLIEDLLSYSFYDYHGSVKSNYRSAQDPLFSWWYTTPSGMALFEQLVGRDGRITINKSNSNNRIYTYSPVRGNKKGFYLINHRYLKLNVYLCIGNGFLIRLKDIDNVVDAFSELKKISKRCYVTYPGDIGRYVIDFLQLHGSKDVRMLERVEGAAGQNIETIKTNLKNSKKVNPDDLDFNDPYNNAEWFDGDQGQISEFSLDFTQLPFDNPLDILNNKYFIVSEDVVYCLFFHIEDTEGEVMDMVESPKKLVHATSERKRGLDSPSTSTEKQVRVKTDGNVMVASPKNLVHATSKS